MESLKTFSSMISRYAKRSLFPSKSGYTDAVAQRTYVARNEDEHTLYPGDVIRNIVWKQGCWWKGELRGKPGIFHEKYVVLFPQRKDKTTTNDSTKSNKGQEKQYAKVLFNYIPLNEDEFRLEVGDIIEVWDEVEDGWWSGILGDQFGVFPSNYVVLLHDRDINSNNKDCNEEFYSDSDEALFPKEEKQNLLLSDEDEYKENDNSLYKEVLDSVKRTSPKLTHPTIARDKGPKRNPPSRRTPPSIVKKAIAKFEASSAANLDIREEILYADHEKTAKGDGVQGNITAKYTAPSKPKVAVQPNIFLELKQKIRELENQIEDLKEELSLLQKNYAGRTEHQKLKIEVDSLRDMIVTHRQYCSKLMSDLMCEVDEEKKLRSVVQIQLDRIMQLLTCTCPKSAMQDAMATENTWSDTSV